MSFERTVTTELWRKKDITVTVVYATSVVASIKGLRGTLSTADFITIAGILAREGYTTVLYETENAEGTLLQKSMQLTERHKDYKGGWHRRSTDISE